VQLYARLGAPNVVSIKVRVLARATLLSLGHIDTKTYDMGLAGAVGPFNDSFKRHMFADAIRLVEVSGRREIPQ
jgi:type IV pilus assembly protein PilW